MGQFEFQSAKRKIESRKDSAGQEKGPERETLNESAEDACLPNIRTKTRIPLTQSPVLIITKSEKWSEKSGIKRAAEGETQRNRKTSAF